MPGHFIKGFEISRPKVATIVDPSKVDIAIVIVVVEHLDRDGFKFIACGDRPGHRITRPLVIVLDDDDDEEALRQRPLGDIHPSILRVMEILEGPDVWENVWERSV